MTDKRFVLPGVSSLAIVCLLLTASLCSAAAVFTENFDGTTFPPAGWTQSNASGTSLAWKTSQGALDANLTGGTGQSAVVYSTSQPRTIYNCALVSPAINLPATGASLALTFRQVLQTWSGDETADIDISVDGGVTWANGLRFKNVKSLAGNATVPLTPYLGKTVRVRFRYYNPTAQAWDLYWQIDDVRVAAGLQGDINVDGSVDVVDLMILAESWGLTAGQPGFNSACDFDGNGAVDVSDLLELSANFGRSA